jgi:hypothetical protein
MALSDIQIEPTQSLQVATFNWPLSPSVSVIPYDSLDVEYQFQQLRRKWRDEYGASSSARAIVNSPSYKRIIFMGNRVVPFICRDLEQSPEPDYWFAALKEITNMDPVSQGDHGNMRAMAKAWVKWAKTNGYTW